jgi:dienelactone hydrolase
MPDLFRNDPVPSDALSNPTSTFNLTAWRARHPQSSIDAIIATTLAAIHTGSDLPPPLSPTPHVGGVGYCFGGKYIARFLASAPPGNHALSAGFTAHPSAVLASEWSAVAAPISIAFGELDASNTAENRTAIEQIFGERNATFQTALYAAAEHGFAVRTDRSDRKKAFAQEAAYLQAVRWLDAWVRDGDEEVDL